MGCNKQQVMSKNFQVKKGLHHAHVKFLILIKTENKEVGKGEGVVISTRYYLWLNVRID